MGSTGEQVFRKKIILLLSNMCVFSYRYLSYSFFHSPFLHLFFYLFHYLRLLSKETIVSLLLSIKIMISWLESLQITIFHLILLRAREGECGGQDYNSGR